MGLVVPAGKLCLRNCTRAVARRLGSFWSLPPCVVVHHGEIFALVSSCSQSCSPLGWQKSCTALFPKPDFGGRLLFIFRDLTGGTYERRSVSSCELSRRIVEPLFGISVGVCSLGVSEYEGGAAEYPGGPPIGVKGRSIVR